MTDLEKKARGLEWIVDVIVQLPDNCTVPLYYDADNAVPRSVHFGINEDLASSLPRPQIHFALVYFGVAPEFNETVEAQEAHSNMFDLVLETHLEVCCIRAHLEVCYIRGTRAEATTYLARR